MPGRLTAIWKSRSGAVALAAGAIAVACFALPPWLAALIFVVSSLVLVARFDNQAGTFLPLALLLVIVITVLLVLIGGMAMLRT